MDKWSGRGLHGTSGTAVASLFLPTPVAGMLDAHVPATTLTPPISTAQQLFMQGNRLSTLQRLLTVFLLHSQRKDLLQSLSNAGHPLWHKSSLGSSCRRQLDRPSRHREADLLQALFG